MQSGSKQRKRSKTRHKNDYLLLSVITLFSCIIGLVFGAGGVLIYQQTTAFNSSVENNNPLVSPGVSVGAAPPEDGFFIIDGNDTFKIPKVFDDNTLDFTALPTVSDVKPVFAVQGNELPIGNLKLIGYYAGIGVDLNFTESGALINSVFEGSPAQAAGLQPGEIILSLNGDTVKSPGVHIYTPGKNDLIGLMQEQVTIEVVSGTNTRIVNLPRTYHATVNDSLLSLKSNCSYTIEPQGNYLLLRVDRELEPGTYRFEFQSDERIPGEGMVFGTMSTPTPLPSPIPLPLQKWIFIVP